MVSSKFNTKGKIQPPPPVCKDSNPKPKKPKTAINYCLKPTTIPQLEGITQITIPSGPGAGNYQINLPIIPHQLVPGAWSRSTIQGDLSVTMNTTFNCAAGYIKSGAEVIHEPSGTIYAWSAQIPVQTMALGTVTCGPFTLLVGPPGATFAGGWISTI